MSVVNREFWQEKWQDGETPWDLGQAHPKLAEMVDFLVKLGMVSLPGPAYVPGCGRAHDAGLLARRGFVVWAADFVPEAIEAAKRLYGKVAHLHLEVADALTVAPNEIEKYALIYDRAMLCALFPDQREIFIAAMEQRLRDGGIFISIPFTGVDYSQRPPEVKKEGPPFAISPFEFFRLMEKNFTLVKAEHIAQASPVPGTAVKQEMIMIWRKRKK